MLTVLITTSTTLKKRLHTSKIKTTNRKRTIKYKNKNYITKII